MKTLNQPVRWLKIDNNRNSDAAIKFENLDWSNWWLDTSLNAHYLHVAHKDGDTWHRVYCKRADTPRIGVRGGTLFWII